MADDWKASHAQEFTDIERQTLRLWFDVDLAGNDALADSLLNAGLQFEHLTSLLSDDPGQRTPAQLALQQRLAFDLSIQVSLAEEFLRTVGGRPAANAAAFRQWLARWGAAPPAAEVPTPR